MITNFKNLARNPLRQKALLIAEAGYESIDIKKIITKRIKIKNGFLEITLPASPSSSLIYKTKPLKFNIKKFKKIFILGIGKGSALACATLAKILNNKLTQGIALDIKKLKTQNTKLKTFLGTHPLPSIQNIKATQKIIKLAKSAGKNDLIINFICGGGSALLCSSNKELKYSRTIFKELTKAGADILELNTIRKHVSEIKGGGLAKIAYPASVISLIVSDVLGNDLPMVASGPTVYDKTTKQDAEKILKKYGLNPKKFHLVETPKNKKYFKRACPVPKQGFWCGVKNILFLSNREPILAMQEKAKNLGFKTKIYSLKIQGEAKNALLPLMKILKGGEVVLAAGETTVKFKQKVKNDKSQELGKGGRNQESVLGAINRLQDTRYKIQDTIIISFASDGYDNTEAAGALADYLTIEQAEKMNLDRQKFLDNHDSFSFFKKTGDLIFTKPKTFNVSDLMLVLSSPKE